MDSRALKHFVALAETLHFGLAAARMNMTQPPFSRQIANLEADLGVQLFERTSRQVRLTVAGAHFLTEARAILAHLARAASEVRQVAEGQAGTLRLGFMMHAADNILPALLRRFRDARPGVRVALREIVPSEIVPRLLQDEIDAGITFAFAPVAGLRALPLMSDRLALILPPGHPLERRDPVTPSDLRQEALILAPAAVAGALHAAVTGWFLRAGFVPRIGLEPALQHSIVKLVAAGLGVALVPESVTAAPGIAVRRLADAPVLDLVLAVREESRNPAVAALTDLTRRA